MLKLECLFKILNSPMNLLLLHINLSQKFDWSNESRVSLPELFQEGNCNRELKLNLLNITSLFFFFNLSISH
jgi:hypothetical protein